MMKTPPTVMPDFVRINDGDLSEIELHSVDSINDLHVEHFSKGSNRPPQGHSNNGTLQERPVVSHTGHRVRFCWRKRIFRLITATVSRSSCGCMAIALLLVMIGMIFCFLVWQGSVLQALFQQMRDKQVTLELSQLINELRRNITSIMDCKHIKFSDS